MRKKDFSKITMTYFKNSTSIVAVFFLLVLIFICFQVYMPANPMSKESVVFTLQKGWSEDTLAANLKKLGLIRSTNFFKFYAIVSLKYSNLQAGEYN